MIKINCNFQCNLLGWAFSFLNAGIIKTFENHAALLKSSHCRKRNKSSIKRDGISLSVQTELCLLLLYRKKRCFVVISDLDKICTHLTQITHVEDYRWIHLLYLDYSPNFAHVCKITASVLWFNTILLPKIKYFTSWTLSLPQAPWTSITPPPNPESYFLKKIIRGKLVLFSCLSFYVNNNW